MQSCMARQLVESADSAAPTLRSNATNVVLFPADHAADGQFEGGSRPDCREASERKL